jgi:ribosomal protein S18 acetylase RimI-like enzyme
LAQIYPIVAATPELARMPGILSLPEDLETALLRPHEVFLVAHHGGDLAGFLYVIQETNITATVRFLYTLPQFRRHGIARSLLAHCCDLLVEDLDIKEISAFVSEGTALDLFLSTQDFRRGSGYIWLSKTLMPRHADLKVPSSSGDPP